MRDAVELHGGSGGRERGRARAGGAFREGNARRLAMAKRDRGRARVAEVPSARSVDDRDACASLGSCSGGASARAHSLWRRRAHARTEIVRTAARLFLFPKPPQGLEEAAQQSRGGSHARLGCVRTAAEPPARSRDPPRRMRAAGRGTRGGARAPTARSPRGGGGGRDRPRQPRSSASGSTRRAPVGAAISTRLQNARHFSSSSPPPSRGHPRTRPSLYPQTR